MMKEIKKEENCEVENDESFSEDDGDFLNEISEFCDNKIEKETEVFLETLRKYDDQFILDTLKQVEPDLMIILDNKNDEDFLEEAEINELQIQQLDEKLKKLKFQKEQIKKKIQIFDKKHPRKINPIKSK